MTKVLSFRVSDEEAAWADEYVASRGLKRQDFLAAGFRSYREDCRRGVPDVPVGVPAPRPTAPSFTDEQRAEQETRAAVWARQVRLNEAKERASR